jgi:hypothetical protein
MKTINNSRIAPLGSSYGKSDKKRPDPNGAKIRAIVVKSRTVDERVTKQTWLNLVPFRPDPFGAVKRAIKEELGL